MKELQKNAHQKDYLQVEGLPELREAIAKYRSSKHGVQISSSNIMIGPGSKELLFLLQLCYHGELLLPNPSWVSYAPQAKIIGRKTVAGGNWDGVQNYRIYGGDTVDTLTLIKSGSLTVAQQDKVITIDFPNEKKYNDTKEKIEKI